MQNPDYILNLQQRIVAGENISAEELNAAIEQLRTERETATTTRSSTPTKAAAPSLAAFLASKNIVPGETK